MDPTWVSTAITSIVTILGGGTIGTLVSLKFLRKKEAAKSDQEFSKAIELELNNTNDIIRMYKSALSDIRKQSDQMQALYQDKIDAKEIQLKKYLKMIEECNNQLKSNTDRIDELTRVQLKQKLEIETLKLKDQSKCNTCEFNSNCEKLKAKRLTNEQVSGTS